MGEIEERYNEEEHCGLSLERDRENKAERNHWEPMLCYVYDF